MNSVWYGTTFLGVTAQCLLLSRGFRCGLWARYPLFYVYVLYTAFWSVVLRLPAVARHPAYPWVYWLSQVIAAVLRFGVAAEIYRHVFPHNSSLRKTAGMVVTAALTLLALSLWTIGASPASSTILDSFRKITLSVAAWIVLVLGMARYYGIRIGRNIWGMTVGLLLFSGSELIYLASVDLFPSLRPIAWNVHPIAYVCMLLIWTWALWNYSPNPEIVPLEKMARHQLLSAWEDRQKAIAYILRKVTKP